MVDPNFIERVALEIVKESDKVDDPGRITRICHVLELVSTEVNKIMWQIKERERG